MPAKELVTPGEKAVVIFTKRDRFYTSPNNTGSTGKWEISKATAASKAIIYLRGET